MYDVDGPGKLSLKGIDDACTKNGFASSDSGNARPPFMESKPGPPALDRAFSNSTKPRSPRTITLGVEVETVIGNHDDCDNILPKVLSSMRKLQAQGTWDIGADVYLRHKEPVPDRRKFLVMEDNRWRSTSH